MSTWAPSCDLSVAEIIITLGVVVLTLSVLFFEAQRRAAQTGVVDALARARPRS